MHLCKYLRPLSQLVKVWLRKCCIIHPQKTQLTPLYIFISVSCELYLYSWIVGLDDDIQCNELFLPRVQWRSQTRNYKDYYTRSPQSKESLKCILYSFLHIYLNKQIMLGMAHGTPDIISSSSLIEREFQSNQQRLKSSMILRNGKS